MPTVLLSVTCINLGILRTTSELSAVAGEECKPRGLTASMWLGYGNNFDVHCCLGRVEPSGLWMGREPSVGGRELLQVQPSLCPKLNLDGALCLPVIW